METGGLWKYCTPKLCREFILSMELIRRKNWDDNKKLACLYALSNHPEKHYRRAYIPKRNGGTRCLMIPDELLMEVQRNILHHVLDQLPVSAYATAYRRGAGICEGAALHTGKNIVLKMDMENFFDHILFFMVFERAFPAIYFPPAAAGLLTNLCCYREHLPQGAPTSAAISNLVMKPFDEYMGKWCGDRDIAYTRYSDDLTFSGNFDAAVVERKVRGFLESCGFNVNRSKTSVCRQGMRQQVTGLTVNEKVQVPPAYRRRLRQEIYYCEKYGVKSHLERSGRGGQADSCVNAGERTEAECAAYLRGLLGKVNFCLQANPEDQWYREAAGRLKRLLEG